MGPLASGSERVLSNMTVVIDTDLVGRDPYTRAGILAEAEVLINGDRALQYGDALDTHERIAELWGAVLGPKQAYEITPTDVALMMICVKIIRATRTPNKADSWIDIAGYAALGAEFANAR